MSPRPDTPTHPGGAHDEADPEQAGRRRRVSRRVLAATAGLVAISGLVVGAVVVSSDDEAVAELPAPSTTTTTTTTAPPPLPVPSASPADAYEDVPVFQIGTIEIPKIGLVHPVYEGIWLTVIDHGPGHWPGSAAPGAYGNSVFAGHRVTHSRPFRNIDQLVAGDEIIVTTEHGRFVYQMTGTEVVDPQGMHVIDQEPGHQLTLFACHPPGSAAYRYVVFGELVSESLEEVTAPTRRAAT